MNDKTAKVLRGLARVAAVQEGVDWRQYYKYYKKRPPPQAWLTQVRKNRKEFLEASKREVKGT